MAGNTNPQTLLGGYINRRGGDRVTGEPAFVLRMEPWSETSLLVDFYTRISLDWGIASAIALLLLIITGGLIAVMARLPGEHRLI